MLVTKYGYNFFHQPPTCFRTNDKRDILCRYEKSTTKRGPGTHDFPVTSCGDKSVIAVEWFDNRSVTMLSNCCSIDPVAAVRRGDKKAKDALKDLQTAPQSSKLTTAHGWSRFSGQNVLQLSLCLALKTMVHVSILARRQDSSRKSIVSSQENSAVDGTSAMNWRLAWCCSRSDQEGDTEERPPAS